MSRVPLLFKGVDNEVVDILEYLRDLFFNIRGRLERRYSHPPRGQLQRPEACQWPAAVAAWSLRQ